MTQIEAFGVLLRAHRHDLGLTLEGLADSSGVSVRAIGNMELGRSRGPQRKTIEAIADSLALAGESRRVFLLAAQSGRRRVLAPAPGALAMPRAIADFVGRISELAFISDLLDEGPTAPAAVVAVSGQPGVGKTSFAGHAAATLADRFPDGQFFLDLRGLDERPPEPVSILARLIAALAPEYRQLPPDEGERAGLYRTILTRRRVLIILDNAADEAQVRPLLPGDGPSMVLVTSRRQLTGLEAVHRLPLVPLPHLDAEQMLREALTGRGALDQQAGQGKVQDAAIARLAELSGYLPLALRLLGNRLATDPGGSLARFVARLEHQERRLEILAAGDVQITAVFRLSYIQISPDAQQLFRRLALIPGADTSPAMAAVLNNAAVEDTEDALDELVEFGLLQSRFADRYRLHDLLRLFAYAQLLEQDSVADIAAAQDRVEQWLLSTTIVAGRWFEPAYGVLPPDWDHRVPLDSREQAQRWIEGEADNWLAALRTAADRRQFEAVVTVAEALHWFSDHWWDWGHWTEVSTLASSAAEHLGDDLVFATQLNYLSWALSECDGDHPAAIDCAERAFAAAKRAGDLAQQGWARSYEAGARMKSGDPTGALAAALESVRLMQLAGDREGLPSALEQASRCYEELGEVDDALAMSRQRLTVVTDPRTAPAAVVASGQELLARTSIGRLHASQHNWAAVVHALLPAVDLAREVGVARWEAPALAILGEALCEVDRPKEGIPHLRRAEQIYQGLGAWRDTQREAVASLLRIHTAPLTK